MSVEKSFMDLPYEVKHMILERCTNQTRSALRAVSHCTREIVDVAKLNYLDELILEQESEKEFGIRSRKSESQLIWNTLKFDSFNDFQRGVNRLMKWAPCIKQLTMRNIKEKIELGQWHERCQMRAVVENVKMEFEDPEQEQYKNILSQLEPGHLSRINLARGNDSAMFDLPQIIHAEELTINGPIQEDQLLKLEAQSVVIENELRFSLRNFVEKCRSRERSQMKQFVLNSGWSFEELKEIYAATSDRIMLDTSDSRQKLELYFEERSPDYLIIGEIRYESERIATEVLFPEQPVLRTIEWVKIDYSPNSRIWTIGVLRSLHRFHDQRFKSFEKFQERLDEILEITDCIGKLEICLLPHPSKCDNNLANKIRWTPRTNKLLVKKLLVHGNHSFTSIRDLLDQVDPDYMRCLDIDSKEIDETLFDFPHVYNCTEGVSINGSVLRPDQLARKNGGALCSGDFNEYNQNLLLTSTDINQYIKKFLLTSQHEKQRRFWFYNLSPTINEEEILEGLEITSTQGMRGEKLIMIDSPDRKCILELEFLATGFKTRISGFKKERV